MLKKLELQDERSRREAKFLRGQFEKRRLTDIRLDESVSFGNAVWGNEIIGSAQIIIFARSAKMGI